MRRLFLTALSVLALLSSCTGGAGIPASNRYASYFEISEDGLLSVISPYTGEADTLYLDEPMDNIVCMSTSHIGYLDAIGMTGVVSAVSGLDYASSPELRAREDVYDIGYDPEINYERIIALDPDVVLAYSVSAVVPQYVAKLESLGIRTLVLSDHMENHPLARAEYIRLFGALTGTMDKADSVFSAVEARYLEISSHADTSDRRKVLFNMPYSDQWYIPGGDSYMSRLVRDAGGEVLGCEHGTSASSVIPFERAYMLSREADVWLHPGSCRSWEEMVAANHLLGTFSVGRIYNNTLRTNPEGGNDFWESGAARPDLILEDLVRIMRGETGSFNYYLEVN